MTKLHEEKEFIERPIDLLVGGTPCQSFSVAGLRKGLADPRGNLALHFLKILDAKRPQWVVWENVPGVLSSISIDGGLATRDFGTFLAGLRELGYGFAYRILDAQYFGVPQRRRRVFVVGYLGDWRPAAAVLFERQSLSGDPAPSRKEGERPAPTISSRPTGGGGLGTDFDLDGGLVTAPLTGNPYADHESRESLLILDDQGGNQMNVLTDGKVGAMRAHQHQHQPIIFQPRSPDGYARVSVDGQVPTLDRMGGGQREPCIVLPLVFKDREGKGNGGKGLLVSEDKSFTVKGQDQAIAISNETFNTKGIKGEHHASTYEADSSSLLSVMRKKVGKKAFAEWGLRVLIPLQSEEVLRLWLHGKSVREQAQDFKSWVDGRPLKGETDMPEGSVCKVWEQGPNGCSPSGRGLAKQLIHQLGKIVPQLSHERSSTGETLQTLWKKAEGFRVLRQALSEIETSWRPPDYKVSDLSRKQEMQVRRLTPIECEKLQGFLPNYTLIPWRRGMAPDGPRYKALGNSMAVPVMRWIGKRIELVSDSLKSNIV